MTVRYVDALGLRCPQPILKITIMLPEMQSGDILEAVADCSTFEDDVRKWCARMNKTLLAVTHDGDKTTVQIQF